MEFPQLRGITPLDDTQLNADKFAAQIKNGTRLQAPIKKAKVQTAFCVGLLCGKCNVILYTFSLTINLRGGTIHDCGQRMWTDVWKYECEQCEWEHVSKETLECGIWDRAGGDPLGPDVNAERWRWGCGCGMYSGRRGSVRMARGVRGAAGRRSGGAWGPRGGAREE